MSLSSNCIPNAERLQAALAGLTPTVTSDQAVDHIRKQSVVTTDANGRQRTITIPSNATLKARQLVVYAQPSSDLSNGLQLHLAWEIEVTNGPVKTVYLDAMSDQVLAAS